MAERDFDKFRAAYDAMRAAQERHAKLMHTALRGEPYSREELMASATECQRLQAEFMKAGEPFIHSRSL